MYHRAPKSHDIAFRFPCTHAGRPRHAGRPQLAFSSYSKPYAPVQGLPHCCAGMLHMWQRLFCCQASLSGQKMSHRHAYALLTQLQLHTLSWPMAVQALPYACSLCCLCIAPPAKLPCTPCSCWSTCALLCLQLGTVSGRFNDRTIKMGALSPAVCKLGFASLAYSVLESHGTAK